MKYLVVIALASVMATGASANMGGRWSGSGDMNLGAGRITNCRTVELETRLGIQSFDLVRGGAACDYGSFTFPIGRMENVNGILKANGFAVGRIGSDYFYVTWSNRPGELLIIDVRQNADGTLSLTATDSRPGRMSVDLRANLTRQYGPGHSLSND